MHKSNLCFSHFRFVLDHPGLFQGHTVLDVGSGCGASAIAVAMTGADRVIANDVDPCKKSLVKTIDHARKSCL